jgi:hypothetical protein
MTSAHKNPLAEAIRPFASRVTAEIRLARPLWAATPASPIAKRLP